MQQTLLIELGADLFKIADKIEVTAEMDPTSVETKKLSAFSDAGINQTVGIQSLDEAGLEFWVENTMQRKLYQLLKLPKNIFL